MTYHTIEISAGTADCSIPPESAGGLNEKIGKLLKDILELDVLTPEMVRKFTTCKYLIIIDMGCGNTSAALLNLERFRNSGSSSPDGCIDSILWKYNLLDNDGTWLNSTPYISIPTIIGYQGNTCHVGPSALLTGNSRENFKTCPNEQNLNKVLLKIRGFKNVTSKPLKEVWQDYFREILAKIETYCRTSSETSDLTVGEGGNTLVMVAHPAGSEWSDPQILDNYRELVTGTTKIEKERVITVSEAKAAMQYVRRYSQGRRSGEGTLAIHFAKGVLIIDIGASTIDIEYLDSSSDEPIEYSLTMAGREVDRLLAHYALEKEYPAEMARYPAKDQIPGDNFFQDRKIDRSIFLYDARTAKEGLSNAARNNAARDNAEISASPDEEMKINWNGGKHMVPVTVPLLRDLLGENNNNPIEGMVNGSKKLSAVYELPMALDHIKKKERGPGYRAIQQVEDTWYGHLENFVEYVVSSLAESGRFPSQVIVTGGSCRLLGIRDHVDAALKRAVENHWDVDKKLEETVYLDQVTDYENAVPHGGAYFVGGILKHMGELAAFPPRLRETVCAELPAVIAKKLTERIDKATKDIAERTLKWWSELENGHNQTTVNAFEAMLKGKLNTFFDENNLLGVTAKVLKELKPEDLTNTMKEVNGLLDKLAETKYSGKPTFRDIQIDFSGISFSRFLRDIDVNKLMHPVMYGWFKDWWDNSDSLQKQGKRIKAYNKYRTQPIFLIVDSLQANLENTLVDQFENANWYNIPEQMLDDLITDIKLALNMSLTGGEQT